MPHSKKLGKLENFEKSKCKPNDINNDSGAILNKQSLKNLINAYCYGLSSYRIQINPFCFWIELPIIEKYNKDFISDNFFKNYQYAVTNNFYYRYNLVKKNIIKKTYNCENSKIISCPFEYIGTLDDVEELINSDRLDLLAKSYKI